MTHLYIAQRENDLPEGVILGQLGNVVAKALAIDALFNKSLTRRRVEILLSLPDVGALSQTSSRVEPAAFVGPNLLATRPTFRHFSSRGTGVPPRQKRLLVLSCRADETEP